MNPAEPLREFALVSCWASLADEYAENVLTLPQPKPGVVYRDLPEGAVLFCPRTEVYYSLNAVGSQIWRLLPPACASESDLLQQLSELYPEVARETLEADLRQLLNDLVASGLAGSSQSA